MPRLGGGYKKKKKEKSYLNDSYIIYTAKCEMTVALCIILWYYIMQYIDYYIGAVQLEYDPLAHITHTSLIINDPDEGPTR